MSNDPTDREIQNLGRALRAARLRRNMPQELLEYKTGVAQETISGIETGARTNPLLRTVIKLARYLGVSIEDLLQGDRH